MNDQKLGEALFWLYLSVFPKDIKSEQSKRKIQN